ncbi:MAG: hypothetical protein U0175_35020 [Caldilineaceae bacterium]
MSTETQGAAQVMSITAGEQFVPRLIHRDHFRFVRRQCLLPTKGHDQGNRFTVRPPAWCDKSQRKLAMTHGSDFLVRSAHHCRRALPPVLASLLQPQQKLITTILRSTW